MQLQIECNHLPLQKQRCLLCTELFETTEATVIVCNDEGTPCGEACPHCLRQGFEWMSHRFEQINQIKKIDLTRSGRSRKVPVGA